MSRTPCLILFLVILPLITVQSFHDNDHDDDRDDDRNDGRCMCPPNEKPGDRKCNGCEPSCDNLNPAFCTLMICPPCTCECADGLVRDSISNKCVPKEQCP